MTRTPAANERWMDEGTFLFLASLDRLTDADLDRATELPGWSGRHLVAHVAANARALCNLATWAATGRETPMYSSPTQRVADIETGSRKSPAELRAWVKETADELGSALDNLYANDWSRQVRTAQGRLVPASEVPWMRAREVMVHAVDLDPDRTFDDLPGSFCMALIEEIVAKRSAGTHHPALILHSGDRAESWTIEGDGEPTQVHGTVAGVAAFLAGRRTVDVSVATGAIPEIPAWL